MRVDLDRRTQTETLTCNTFAPSSSPRSLPTFLDLRIIIASCSCRKGLSIPATPLCFTARQEQKELQQARTVFSVPSRSLNNWPHSEEYLRLGTILSAFSLVPRRITLCTYGQAATQKLEASALKAEAKMRLCANPGLIRTAAYKFYC